LFFFSSRRRHTRFSRDWSSDVCSSDLIPSAIRKGEALLFRPSSKLVQEAQIVIKEKADVVDPVAQHGDTFDSHAERKPAYFLWKIGRASCRERVETSEVAVSVRITKMR